MKRSRIRIALFASLLCVASVACSLLTTPRGPLKFEPEKLPEAQAGAPYDVKISITGNVTPAGAFSISEGSLPKGLALDNVEGEHTAHIHGVPEEAGSFTFKVYAWCYGTNVNGQQGEQEYVLTVR
ncbi:MAG TPA: Ig domain-containing protein [Anaerolineales bacterium]|nr:Ig domain-containing protein [Anaerolineales bacterium]